MKLPLSVSSYLDGHSDPIGLSRIHRLAGLLDFLQHGLVFDAVDGRYVGGLCVEANGVVFDACAGRVR